MCRVSSSQVVFVVAAVAGCISIITNMSFSGPSIGSGGRIARRAFEFGRTYVVKPKGKHQATIVWLHGLGDNGSRSVSWIIGFDVSDLSEDGNQDVEGMDASAAHVLSLLSTEPPNVKLGIGGFSMGAATALYSASCFTHGKFGNGNPYSTHLNAVVGLSGWLPCANDLNKKVEGEVAANRASSLPVLLCHGKANRASSLPVLLCHGKADDVIRFRFGEKSAQKLISTGFKNLTFKGYDLLGHYTIPEEMDEVCSWLTSKLELEDAMDSWGSRSMFEISGNNFNDWFLQLKMVLRVERKLFVIEQPISLASPTDSEYLRSGMRMRENQLAHMSLDEELCGTANKKSLNAKGKNKVKGKGNDKKVYIPQPKNPKPTAMERPTKDDACHHCKEVGHCKRNCPAYLAELIKKKKQVGTASSSDIVTTSRYVVPTCRVKVPAGRYVVPIGKDNVIVSAGRSKVIPAGRTILVLEVIILISLASLRIKNKTVVARYAEFFEKRFISQEISRREVDLEEIQEEEDRTPSEITSNIPQEVGGFERPQEEVIPIRRSGRTHRAPNRLCLNVEVEEHSLGDLGEPTNYKAVMLDPESNKWIDAMNVEIQSMMDNMVWVLVNLPSGCKTVGSKWIFEKKTNMDGTVHTYKDRFVANGYTQLYGVDYEETFLPVADIRAIRILISIAAFYDYEIWKMDVKTAFSLNGYLDAKTFICV
ncbi:retrotransposon protein, putative, ty1-copia subclass [Tanacetum coccineum]